MLFNLFCIYYIFIWLFIVNSNGNRNGNSNNNGNADYTEQTPYHGYIYKRLPVGLEDILI